MNAISNLMLSSLYKISTFNRKTLYYSYENEKILNLHYHGINMNDSIDVISSLNLGEIYINGYSSTTEPQYHGKDEIHHNKETYYKYSKLMRFYYDINLYNQSTIMIDINEVENNLPSKSAIKSDSVFLCEVDYLHYKMYNKRLFNTKKIKTHFKHGMGDIVYIIDNNSIKQTFVCDLLLYRSVKKDCEIKPIKCVEVFKNNTIFKYFIREENVYKTKKEAKNALNKLRNDIWNDKIENL